MKIRLLCAVLSGCLLLSACRSGQTAEIPLDQPLSAPPSYTSYAGPILPLTADTDGLTADRQVSADLSSGDGIAQVTDCYVLRNPGSEARTVKLYYPFRAATGELDRYTPRATLDDAPLAGAVRLGGYRPAHSFDEIVPSLEDGAALQSALEQTPEYRLAVDVYTFEDMSFPEGAYASFEIPTDGSPRAVFGFGVSSSYAQEDGLQGFGLWSGDDGGRARIVALESLPEDAALRFYSDPAREQPAEGGHGRVVRRTMSFTQAMEECLSLYLSDRTDQLFCGDQTLLFRAVMTAADSTVLRGPQALYGEGLLESMFTDALFSARINYLESEARIPAGGSISVCYAFQKDGSFDQSMRAETRNVYGYELATVSGSALSFEQVSASATLPENCALVWQQPELTLQSDGTAALSADEAGYFAAFRFS